MVNLTNKYQLLKRIFERTIRVTGYLMATVHLFHKTYDETLALLVTARDYMSYAVPVKQPDVEPAQRLQVSCEAMRVTARLSHVMAWLLAQKAVQAGEITSWSGGRGLPAVRGRRLPAGRRRAGGGPAGRPQGPAGAAAAPSTCG